MELQQRLPEIAGAGGQVMAASVDPLAMSRSLAEQLHLGYPILEDTGHALGSAFGVFRLPAQMDMGPVDRHAMFVLDSAGRVRWRQLAPDTMRIPIADVVAALRSS